jgi:hypothetical protein
MDTVSHQALEPIQRSAARLVGFLYLFTNGTAIYAFTVRNKLIVPRDAAQTAANIAGSELLFRSAIAMELLTIAAVILLVWGLYVTLKPVHSHLVWLATFFRLAENFVLAFVTVLEIAVLIMVKNPTYLQAFSSDQSQGLAYTIIRVYDNTFNIGFLFLGIGSAVFSYVWLKSGYIPKLLAGWGIFASSLMALASLALIAFPGLSVIGMAHMMPMGLYEFGLGFWLLIKGVRISTTEPHHEEPHHQPS